MKTLLIGILFFIVCPSVKGQNTNNEYKLSLVNKVHFKDSFQLEDYFENLVLKCNGENDTLANDILKQFYSYSFRRYLLFPERIFIYEKSIYFFKFYRNDYPLINFLTDTSVNIPIGKKFHPNDYFENYLARDYIDSIYWKVKNNILFIDFSYDRYALQLSIKRKQIAINLADHTIYNLKQFFIDSLQSSIIETISKTISSKIWYAGDSTNEIDEEYVMANGSFNTNRNYFIDAKEKLISFNLLFVHKNFYEDELMEAKVQMRQVDYSYEFLGINKKNVKSEFHHIFFE